jgi:hypothetical protein
MDAPKDMKKTTSTQATSETVLSTEEMVTTRDKYYSLIDLELWLVAHAMCTLTGDPPENYQRTDDHLCLDHLAKHPLLSSITPPAPH